MTIVIEIICGIFVILFSFATLLISGFCLFMMFRISTFLVDFADMVKKKLAEIETSDEERFNMLGDALEVLIKRQPQRGLVDLGDSPTYDPRFAPQTPNQA